MPTPTTLTTQQLAEHVGGKLCGPGDLQIDALTMLGQGRPGAMTFVGEAKYASEWADSAASAALVSEGIELDPGPGKALIVVDNADLAMAKALELFTPPDPQPAPGVHPTAVIDPSATLGRDTTVGPWCVIGPGVTLGDGCVLHPRVSIYDDAVIGDHCTFWPGVVIRERCTVGDRCRFHANAVIGTDGFGYRAGEVNGQPGIVKVPHLGHVQIGSDVELGACCAIDKGKFTPTIVGDGSKLDNHVQIGHNCVIGRMVMISGCTGVAGSVTIGDGAMLGGQGAIADHVTIGPGAQLAGGIQLFHDVPAGQRWAGSPGKPIGVVAREKIAIAKLPELMKQVKKFMKS